MKNNKRVTLFAAILAITVLCSSCSVYMAANKSGTDITQIQKAQTRASVLATGAQVISCEKDYDGSLIETYAISKEKGSIARAFMHGVLDVSTCGIWEVVGTPMEGCLSQKDNYIVKVFYDKNENIKKVELK